MKLLYMWIKDYRTLKGIGLNFNCEYNFNFNDEKSELLFTEKSIKIDGFFNIITDEERLLVKLSGDSEEQVLFNLNNRIESLSAIVGNNGAGKTTILDLICEVYTRQLDSLIDGVYCFEENKKIYIHSTLKKNITLIRDNDVEVFKVKLKKTNDFINYKGFTIYNNNGTEVEENNLIVLDNNFLIDNIDVIYFSNEFNSKYLYKKFNPIKDISTSGLIQGYFKDNYENHKISENYPLIKCFRDNEFLREIEYICDSNQNLNKYLDFDLPEKVLVEFRDNSYILLKVYQTLNCEFKEYDNIIDINKKLFEIQQGNLEIDKLTIEKRLSLNIYTIYNMFNMNNIYEKLSQKEIEESLFIQFSIKILIGIFSSFLYEYLIIFSRSKKDNEKFYKIINQSIEKSLQNNKELLEHDELYEFFIGFLKEILEEENKEMSQEVHERDNEYIKCIEKLKSELVQTMVVKTMKYTSFHQEFILEVNDKDIINNIKSFYNYYKITSKSCEYLNFSWGVSSGEYNMISLFARMYSLVKNKKLKNIDNNMNDLIILIDEADLSYHPEWQQKYMKNLLSFLKQNFHGYRIQLILTTHSPILLSDIPKENTIFLKKIKGVTEVDENKEETFGANIYDLYRNGFFLTNSNYGILGNFAIEKIQTVDNILFKLSQEIKTINEKVEKEVKGLLESIDNVNKDNMIVEKTKIIRNKMINDVRIECIKKLNYCRTIIDIIGEEFLRKTLLKQYKQLYEFFNINQEKDSEELREMKGKFVKLSKDEQNDLIKFIIDRRKN